MLIGDGHDPAVVKMVEDSPVIKLGHIKLIRPAKGKDKGELQISGGGGQAEFKDEMELLMKGAKMTFTKWQPAR